MHTSVAQKLENPVRTINQCRSSRLQNPTCTSACGGLRLLFSIVSLFWLTPLEEAAPRHVYLTWQGDTSTTITVNYQTMEDATTSDVYYDTQPRQGDIARYRFHATGTRHKIESLVDGRTIHWVEL